MKIKGKNAGTMIKTSKKTMENIGIAAVKPEESIFQTNKGSFVKVYSVKGLENSEMRKEQLMNSLSDDSEYRIRISSFQYEGNSYPIFFLSVYFCGSSYADVYDEIKKFDRYLEEILKVNIRVIIKPCGISDIFMFIYMNYNGQMKKINPKSVLKKNADWRSEYLKYIKASDNGFSFEGTKKYGYCYMAIQYSENIENFFEKLKELGAVILSCIDFQRVPDKYLSDYKEYIEEIYNGKVESEKRSLLNGTFLFMVLLDSEKELKKMNKFIKEYMERCGITVVNCIGAEQRVVDSIATMGLLDFHCMRNVNEKILSNFLL